MTPILDQWNWKEGECSGFSILWALLRIKPDTDYIKIAKEIIDEEWNSISIMNASAWFIKKWYIKGIRRVKYTPFMSKKNPIITSIRWTDWNKTRIAPFMLTFKTTDTSWSHYVCIDSPWKIVNSWWESFGDKWYFYFTPDQVKKFGQCFIIEI